LHQLTEKLKYDRNKACKKMMKKQTGAALEKLIPEIRIEADIDVMVKLGEKNIHESSFREVVMQMLFFLVRVNRKKKKRRSMSCEQRTWLTLSAYLFSCAYWEPVYR